MSGRSWVMCQLADRHSPPAQSTSTDSSEPCKEKPWLKHLRPCHHSCEWLIPLEGASGSTLPAQHSNLGDAVRCMRLRPWEDRSPRSCCHRPRCCDGTGSAGSRAWAAGPSAEMAGSPSPALAAHARLHLHQAADVRRTAKSCVEAHGDSCPLM